MNPEASNAAKLLMQKVVRLDSIEDVRFIVENATHFLQLKENILVEDNYEFGEGEEDFLIEGANDLILNTKTDLSGPEIALLACFLLTVEAEIEEFTSRQISKKLGRIRKLANVSSTMLSLEGKSQIEVRESSESGAHKYYKLTKMGRVDAEALIKRFSSKNLRLVG